MTGQAEYQYDVFISYSHTDKEWVHGWLLPRLEAASLRVCIDFDFDVGVPSLVNMERAVDNSRRTLLVLTPAWVESEWTEFETLLTQTTDPAARRRRLLPLLLQPCQPPHRIAMLTYADFSQEEEWESQLQRVVAAVRGELRLRDVGPQLSRLWKPEEAPFLVPFPRNPDFVGREEDLATLHEMVCQGDSPACDERSRIVGIRPTVLVGLGGIGKTQLAVEYAHAHRDDCPGGVFWLNAVNPLLYEFAELAETLGLADRETPRERAAHQVWAYLDAHPDTLVVFDNVVEPADLNVPFAPGLIPANLRCRTLFTTWQRDFPRNFQPFEVKVLPEMAAMRLLLRARPEVLEEYHPEWGVARIVCASLGWLPLALELAAAHLGEYPEVTLEGYLGRLRVEGKLATVDDTELRPEDLPTRHEAAVAATLRTQWSRLDEEEDKDARLLFRAAGQFPEATWIPTARLGLLTGIVAEAKPGRPAPLTRALKKLHAVSLIEELTSDRLRLHQLVRELAARQTPKEEAPTFRQWCAANLATAYEDIVTLEDHTARRGVVALEEDLITGLGLLTKTSEVSEDFRSLDNRLQTLLRMLQREAHTLRGWDPEQHPAFFAQQVHYRAANMGLTQLATSAAARLAQLGQPHLALHWRATRESPALERTLTGHEGYVRAVAVTPDGRRAISASEDHTLKVWDLQTGREERTLAGHAGEVRAVALTPDGRCAISASTDLTLKVWDLQTGREERTLAGHADEVYGIAVTPDGCRAISASEDGTLKAWDLQTGREDRTLAGSAGAMRAVVVTPDGRRAISASTDGTLRVWNLQSGREACTLIGHEDSVRAVAVTPDGLYAISGSIDGTLKVWDLQTGRETCTFAGHAGPIYAVAVTPDGQYAISGSWDNTLKIWDLQTGREAHTLAGHGGWVDGVVVTPDSHRAISASGDRTLKVWDLQIVREARTLVGHSRGVLAVAVTPDSRSAISASEGGMLKVWDLQTGQEVRTLASHESAVRAVAVTPDGRCAISASDDTTLKIWDLQTGQEMCTLADHVGMVQAVAVIHDGQWVISASQDRTLKVWDLQTGQEARTMTRNGDWVKGIAVTPDGRCVTFASLDATLKVWDLQTGQMKYNLTGHEDQVNGVAVTPDGCWAISASDDRTLKVWDLKTGQEVRTLIGHAGPVYAVAVTLDGRHVISTARDRTLKVWDLRTEQELATVALEGVPKCVASSPDGVTILTGDAAGNVYCLRYVEGGEVTK
jgi:WD40 repeat protein